MNATRLLAAVLAVNRILVGASYLARPRNAGLSWIGRVSRKPGAQVMVRSQGARDVALGVGALWALTQLGDRDAQAWMAAHALADAADAAATLAVLGDLPKRRARFALGMAGASTAIALAGAVRLRG